MALTPSLKWNYGPAEGHRFPSHHRTHLGLSGRQIFLALLLIKSDLPLARNGNNLNQAKSQEHTTACPTIT